MVRAKGGRRQSRYFQLKEQASNRLCMLMSSSFPRQDIVRKEENISDLVMEIEIKVWASLY